MESLDTPLVIIMRGLINSRLKVLIDVGDETKEDQTVSLLMLLGVRYRHDIKTNKNQSYRFQELLDTIIDMRRFAFINELPMENSYKLSLPGTYQNSFISALL